MEEEEGHQEVMSGLELKLLLRVICIACQRGVGNFFPDR